VSSYSSGPLDTTPIIGKVSLTLLEAETKVTIELVNNPKGVT
jgi:hypothetical protein